MYVPAHLWSDVLVTLIFGGVVIFLLVAAFKIWDWMTKDINEQEELKKNNTAVAITLVGYMLSVAYVIGQVVAHVLGG